MLYCIALVVGVGAYKHLPPIKCAGFEAKLVFGGLQDLATKAILRHDQENGYDSDDGLVLREADRNSLLGAIGTFRVLAPMRQHAVASLGILAACRNPAAGPARPTTAGPTLTYDFGWGPSHTGAGWTRPSSGMRDSRAQLPTRGSTSQSTGGAYVCWATSPYQPTLLMSEFTSHLVKGLFQEKLGVLRAASLAFERLEAVSGGGQVARGEMVGFIGPALLRPLDEWKYLDESLAATRSQQVPGCLAAIDQQQQEAAPLVETWLAAVQRQQFKDVSSTIARTIDVSDLVKALGSLDAATRQSAARALWCLSVHGANAATIAQAGGIPPLIGLLSSPHALDEQRNAAGALASLAMNGESQVAMAQAGAVPPLVRLLGSGSDAVVQQRAALALGELARTPAGQAAIVQAGGISALVKALGGSDSLVQQNAAGVLASLAAESSAGSKAGIAAAGGIPPLVQLLASSNTGVQQQAALALWSLVEDAANKAAIEEAGAMPLLLTLREISDSDGRHA
ncbi:hypothetical protein PLESTF_001081000 [Pleodorina starrii]|nr:hypothetical protein PLESTF_001081000 [Pleodorina starrii]